MSERLEYADKLVAYILDAKIARLDRGVLRNYAEAYRSAPEPRRLMRLPTTLAFPTHLEGPKCLEVGCVPAPSEPTVEKG